jgi:1,2-diacylglycerol 3-alpha-glucosyltransferase
MRVLFITPGFAQNEEDSTCVPPLQSFARGLASYGIELTIIALEYPFHAQAYRWYGISVLPCGGKNKWINKPLTTWKAINYAQKEHGDKPFDIIHSFWFGLTYLIGQYLSKTLNIRHISTFMGQDTNKRVYHSIFQLWPQNGALVVLSKFQQGKLLESSGISVPNVISWGLDPADFSAMLTDPALRSIDIVGVGALIPVKNWHLWLQVIAIIAKDNPKINAELIGEGPERSALEAYIQKMGFQKNVVLKGSMPREAVLKRMAQAKILLHTADFEGFGYVLVEAAHLGCKVISTPVGCAPEWASCAVHAQALAELVQQQLLNPHKRPVHVPMIAGTIQQYLDLYAVKTQ